MTKRASLTAQIHSAALGEVLHPKAMTESTDAVRGVELPDGASASTFFRDLIVGAIEQFDDTFFGLVPPATPAAFKKRLGPFLIAFEQRRRNSPQSAEIAAHIVEQTHATMRFGGAPLAELTPAPGLDIDDIAASQGTAGWVPDVQYEGERYEGAGLRKLLDRLRERNHIGPAAAMTLARAIDRLDSNGGRWDLTDQRFALLGAGAEIAPTAALLQAGATVLWCDVHEPPAQLRASPGRLLHARGRGDLLTVPDQVLHAIDTFARQEGPTHLGMFAYAPGKGREWRLGAAMNAIARALPEERLRSVGVYVSPTTPAAPEAADAERADSRWKTRPPWQRLLTGAGVLRANRSKSMEPLIADTVVPLQGVSYQAAQYIEKTLAAEALAARRKNIRVVAPVAPITRTRSIEHPVFAAAFRGTRIFKAEAFPSEVTRTLCALIYLETIVGESPLEPQYFHGGLFHMPFALDSAIRVAAAAGTMMRSSPAGG